MRFADLALIRVCLDRLVFHRARCPHGLALYGWMTLIYRSGECRCAALLCVHYRPFTEAHQLLFNWIQYRLWTLTKQLGLCSILYLLLAVSTTQLWIDTMERQRIPFLRCWVAFLSHLPHWAWALRFIVHGLLQCFLLDVVDYLYAIILYRLEGALLDQVGLLVYQVLLGGIEHHAGSCWLRGRPVEEDDFGLRLFECSAINSRAREVRQLDQGTLLSFLRVASGALGSFRYALVCCSWLMVGLR